MSGMLHVYPFLHAVWCLHNYLSGMLYPTCSLMPTQFVRHAKSYMQSDAYTICQACYILHAIWCLYNLLGMLYPTCSLMPTQFVRHAISYMQSNVYTICQACYILHAVWCLHHWLMLLSIYGMRTILESHYINIRIFVHVEVKINP